MQVETLDDVLTWTRDYHRELSKCLRHCSHKHEETRAQMLLDYLADHERQLEKTLSTLLGHADNSSLNTWCYEYAEKHPIVRHAHCEEPFAHADTAAIMAEIVDQHEQIIELYRHLYSRAITQKTRELLQELLALEEHETMRMVRDSERLEDL